MVQPPPSHQPHSHALAEARLESRGATAAGFSRMTLIFSVLAALMLGIIIGVGLMMFTQPTEETAETAASASATATATATASASESASAEDPEDEAPRVDPAAQARAAKLIRLRKKVKQTRSTKMDAQCAKLKKGFNKGYVFQGGKFSENEFVANASGCVALAKTSKAPWFCCRR